MYGNCAIVAIDSSTTAKSFTGPGLFRANTLADGSCRSPDNADVVYPNPGPYVEYGGSITSSTPPTDLSPCSWNEDTTVTVSPAGGSSASTTSQASVKTTSASASAKSTSTSAVKPATTSTSASTSSSDKPATTTAARTTSRTPSASSSSITTAPAAPTTHRLRWTAADQISKARAEASSSLRSSTTYSRAAQSAPATTTTTTTTTTTLKATSSAAATPKTTTPTAQAASTSSSSSTTTSSSPSATPSRTPPSDQVYLKCLTSTSFALCVGTSCTDMGSVAPGTVCHNGRILMAPSRSGKVKRMDKVVRRAGLARKSHRVLQQQQGKH